MACIASRPPSRRSFLVVALVTAGVVAGMPATALCAVGLLVPNVTGLHSVRVARVETPLSTAEVVRAVRTWPGQIAVGGGRYSMGGQVAIAGGLHLDLRRMARVVWFEPQQRRVRVQAGMRWRDLQDLIDPHRLAVQTMQSYANFTVGGSVSVNAHGRYVGNGPVGHSVQALQLVLADGSVVEASRDRHAELFRAAIGGYGAVGVITEIELTLVDNTRIERVVEHVALDDYRSYFARAIKADASAVLHNADLLPPSFDAPVAVTWRRTDKALTEPAKLVPRGGTYAMEQNVLWVLTELPAAHKLRTSVIHPLLLSKPAVKWRNHEASLDVAELEPRTRGMSTYVLQEYFVPPRHFEAFVRGLGRVLREHRAEVLNISIRHSAADDLSLLPWAKEEVFSFVLFYKQRTHERAQQNVGRWTRELIELALAHDGRYYLPYQLHATKQQFERAYPEVQALRRVKQRWDPQARFSNSLWAKYL